MKWLPLGRLLIKLTSMLPKRYAIAGKKELQQPFFIINSGRTGSTLLNRLLNQHSQVFLPPEQYFLHNLILKFHFYNWLPWVDLSKILVGELASYMNRHQWELEDAELFREIAMAKGEQRALQQIIDKIFRVCAKQMDCNKDFWGDSTPLTARYAKELFRAFPQAKYLFLVRDPRDVACSWKKIAQELPTGNSSDCRNTAMYWLEGYKNYSWLQRRTNVLIVKYEDLVSDPLTELARIQSFLEIGSEPIDTSHISIPSLDFYKQEHFSNLKRPVNTDSIAKWRKELSEKEVNAIVRITGKAMHALGYV